MNKKQMIKEQKKLKQQRKEAEVLFNDDKEVFNVFKIAIGVLLFIGIVYAGINIFNGNWGIFTKDNKKTTEIDSKMLMIGNMFNKEDNEYLVFAYDMSDEKEAFYGALINNYQDTTKSLYYVDLSSGFNTNFIGEKTVISSDLTKLKFGGAALLSIKGDKIIKSYTTEKEIVDFFSQK